MTSEMNWSNIEIDHVTPICMFNVSDGNEIKLAFNRKKTKPLLKYDHHQNGIEKKFLDYELQFIKAYHFIKLTEEGFSEEFH